MVTVSIEQLSNATGVPKLTADIEQPFVILTVTSVGGTIVGLTISWTITFVEHETELLDASVIV